MIVERVTGPAVDVNPVATTEAQASYARPKSSKLPKLLTGYPTSPSTH